MPRRKQYCYDYPRPMVTVDIIIFSIRAGRLEVLLIRRGQEPFAGQWAIPGGFVEMDESLEAAALRELQEETGVCDVPLEQLHAFGDPHRDPRGRVITVAYYALLDGSKLTVKGADDACEADWFTVGALPPLAFDHDQILANALRRLRRDLVTTPVGRRLLPRTFALSDLKRLHEAILGRKLDRVAFRSAMLRRGLLKEIRSTGSLRYRFLSTQR